MIIGIDFDNTIVRYDEVFHRAAVERDLVPTSVPRVKESVRDYLREADCEAEWTELQGYVYGKAIADAPAYEGVQSFLTSVHRAGHVPYVVSHKTKHAKLGPKYDLHDAARQWLRAAGCFDTGLKEDNVFLEETREAKLQRIGTLDCDLFIDDLPEFLLEPSFPQGPQRVLFDPHGKAPPNDLFRIARSWRELTAWVCDRGAQ